VQDWSVIQWEDDIQLAQDAHIDAFALNIAVGDTSNASILSNAFSAATSTGFQLFFSFDYAGNGPWPEADVISLLNQYGSSSAYYHYNGQPFVSTFEGPASSADWSTIKEQTGCFFMPDWSSISAKAALALGPADGLLNWGAWPWGPQEMNTYVDAAYLQYLDGLPYLMPVSPWFYTNLPGYNKNWLWRSDNLWYDRWQEVMFVQPEFIEILTWNDYGESHYIGPLHDDEYAAFSIGKAPYNYALDMPHDGWRLFLPYLIDTYKNNISSITQEGVVAWYRVNPTTSACSNGGTTGNTASQLQIEYEPTAIVQDRIFYSALLTSAADVTVSIGGVSQQGTWTNVPYGDIGIYHGSVPFNGEGAVTVTISRSGTTVASFINGKDITSDCEGGIQNFNAWVGSASGEIIAAVTPPLRIEEQVCTNGTGAGNFAGLCAFTCSYGYCPIGACVCTAMGKAATLPEPQNVNGYPIAGEPSSYDGVCAFACNYGYCPDTACGYVSVEPTESTVSPFLPPACTSGTGDGNLEGLCDFACNYGYCPINSCTCTGTGALNQPPAADNTVGSPISGDDSGLCAFACARDYCPDTACINSTASIPTVVYVDPSVWTGSQMGCQPPCIMVLPESQLSAPTTVTFPPFVTTLEVGWTGSDGFTAITTTTTLSIPDYTATVISFYNINITSGVASTINYPTTSISPPAFSIVNTYPSGITAAPETRTINPPPYPWSVGPDAVPASAVVVNDATIYFNSTGYETTVIGGETVSIGSTDIIIDGSTIPIPKSTATVIAGVTIGATLPVYTEFPTQTIELWTIPIPTPTTVSTNGKSEPAIPCTAWFFFVSNLRLIKSDIKGL
jgi:hypothetical protein